MPVGERAGLKPADQLRKHAGQAMLEAARLNPNLVVLDGNLGNSTGAHDVKKEFPERFFNIGIAEANMVGIGAGLAACGYVPILTSLGSFTWYNAFDQIRLSVALAGLNVKFLGSHSGISTGREGPSSMGTEDISWRPRWRRSWCSCHAIRPRCARRCWLRWRTRGRFISARRVSRCLTSTPANARSRSAQPTGCARGET